MRGCAVPRRYINICNCDMFSLVNVYHLKFCVVCIDVCCSECNGVSNEPISFLVQPIGTHSSEVMNFRCVRFRGELGILNCDYICMCVVNKQFELLEFGLCLCGVSVVMWSSLGCLLGCRDTLCGCSGCCDCGACTVVCVACVFAERV